MSVRPVLVSLDEMPGLGGMNVPAQFYWVLQSPVALAGMARPRPETPWQEIARAGIRHVVCLETDQPGYRPEPLNLLHAVKLQDLYGGVLPNDPEGEAELIRSAADRIVERLGAEEGVVVHCWGGTGRTGTVLGCVLRILGYSGDEVVSYLDGLNRRRGKDGWPESPWQADFVRRFC